MITIEINKYLTLAIAVGVLMLGQFLRKRIRFLETFCIPAPVVGGLVVAIISCILYVAGIVEFVYDDTFREICMVFFFTSVGFQANLKVLKAGGKSLAVFLAFVIGHSADRPAERPCCRHVPCTGRQSVDRHVHRICSHGRRPRDGRRFRPGH